MTIRNPIEWTADQLRGGARGLSGGVDVAHLVGDPNAVDITIHKVTPADLKDAVRQGFADFWAMPTHMMFLAIIYPLAGLFFARLAFGYEMLPILLLLVAGFPLVGPFLAIGLYEMSRRREQSADVTWQDAFGVLRSPAFDSIAVLGLLLFILFLAWVGAGYWLYRSLFGAEAPDSIGQFLADILATAEGWTFVVAGTAMGFAFAVVAATVSVMAFPMLLDRNVGVAVAVRTSVKAVLENPLVFAAWGVIVAAAVAIGCLPFFVGLAIVVPVLAHATWHLYRKTVTV